MREARIGHLAYAPEIAQAMLQPQRASVVVVARERMTASRAKYRPTNL